ncbi:hypothetical protein [Streptomyces sp. NPDC002676]
MKVSRSTVVTAAAAAAAALAATGITYASAASAPVASAPVVSAPVAQEAPAAAAAPLGGGGGGNGNNNGGNGNERGNDNGGKGHEGEEYGRIMINERSYFAHPGDCITVISGLGAKSLNIRNDSEKTVEVFRGAVCDNGAPIATVGPHSQADGVHPHHTRGIHVEDGVVGSFRVVRGHHGDY